MITIKVTNAKVLANLQKFAAAVGKDAGPLIANEARLWCIDGMKEIPPMGIGTAAQKAGKEAVAKDIARAFPLVSINAQTSDEMLRAIERAEETGSVGAYNRIAEKLGRKSRAVTFQERLHRASRNDAGRVPKRRIDQLIVTQENRAARDQHIKKKWGNVGMMKGSLAWCAEKAGSASKMKGTRIPAWIAKQMDKGRAWLGTHVSIAMRGAKTSFKITTGMHSLAVPALRRGMDRRAKALLRKARNLALGKASIVNGKYKILKSDRE